MIAAVLTFFITVVFQGVLGKYSLPFLSVPFLLTIWIIGLASGQLSALNISERGIYVYNEIYALGGQDFVDLYDWLEKAVYSSFIRIYFYSLGAIFFQTGLLAGIFISVGLLIYSRITFVLSVLGFSIVFLFYQIAGIEFNSLGYTYIGFNYILTAIAIGGYFLVPGRHSILWVFILLPAVVLITISTQQIFLVFRISPYSLPFNFVVLMFLYSLKLREKKISKLVETPVQLGSPEKNLYLYSGNLERFPLAYPVAASLPFYGEWIISQGHDGEYTHQGAWKNAWDFIITDKTGSQYKGSGDYADDYFCYGKLILAPAGGMVVEAINNIPDNTIGDVNTKNNWGNTIIIKHNENTYSKLSHLQYHSVEVKEGDFVKQGQIIGKCGNSGRSPFPHLHFQFQETPYIGSATKNYPFAHYLHKLENAYTLKTFEIPQKEQIVANPQKNETVVKALHFIPGQQFKVNVESTHENNRFKLKKGEYNWSVQTDVLNHTFIQSEDEGSLAYLYNNGNLHYFTNYNGSKNNALYWFFLSLYKVPAGYLPNSTIKDKLPANLMFGGIIKYFQDFFSPFFLFLKAHYELQFTEAGNILFDRSVKMKSVLSKKIAGKILATIVSEIELEDDGTIKLEISTKDSKIVISCKNDLA